MCTVLESSFNSFDLNQGQERSEPSAGNLTTADKNHAIVPLKTEEGVLSTFNNTEELIEKIFDYLSTQELAQCALVCTKWKKLSDEARIIPTPLSNAYWLLNHVADYAFQNTFIPHGDVFRTFAARIFIDNTGKLVGIGGATGKYHIQKLLTDDPNKIAVTDIKDPNAPVKCTVKLVPPESDELAVRFCFEWLLSPDGKMVKECSAIEKVFTETLTTVHELLDKEPVISRGILKPDGQAFTLWLQAHAPRNLDSVTLNNGAILIVKKDRDAEARATLRDFNNIEELIKKVFGHLSNKELAKCAPVCTKWKRLSNEVREARAIPTALCNAYWLLNRVPHYAFLNTGLGNAKVFNSFHVKVFLDDTGKIVGTGSTTGVYGFQERLTDDPDREAVMDEDNPKAPMQRGVKLVAPQPGKLEVRFCFERWLLSPQGMRVVENPEIKKVAAETLATVHELLDKEPVASDDILDQDGKSFTLWLKAHSPQNLDSVALSPDVTLIVKKESP